MVAKYFNNHFRIAPKSNLKLSLISVHTSVPMCKILENLIDECWEKLETKPINPIRGRDRGAKESTRDGVRIAIRDFLWSETTGLPVGVYSEDEVTIKTEDVFQHVYRVYPRLPSPYYAETLT